MSITTQQIEALVRDGQLCEARKALRALNLSRIPRSQALAWSNLARRLDLTHLSLRILSPIARRRGSFSTAPEPTAEERIEYAASLRKLGAVDEAAEILVGLDRSKYPQAALQLAFCLISDWRYELAIPLLEECARTLPASSYPRLIAKLNLLEALICERRLEQSRALLSELQRSVDPEASLLIGLKLLELSAQFDLFASGDLDGAEAKLERARQAIARAGNTTDDLFVAKWQAVIRSLRAGEVGADLRRVRERARESGSWETVRDCDFHIGRIARDPEALRWLYYGTPFVAFRRRILETLAEIGFDPGSPEAWPPLLWCGDQRQAPARVFELTRGRVGSERARAPVGHSIHRLLIILCQDFYRPVPLLSIFSKLFPGEHFDPESSVTRVHQTIRRFRQWAQVSRLPVRAREVAGSYRLELGGGLAIAVPPEPLPLATEELRLVGLLCALRPGAGWFTTRDAQAATGLSATSVKDLLGWAARASLLETEGRARRTRFRVA